MLFFLIGFMCCGKTTLGKQLAEEKGYLFIDLDKYIEEKQKCSISDIFAHFGEEYFRKIERQSLLTIINEYKNAPQTIIVACGGGTPCFFDNHTQMKQVGISIYLKENTEILVQRLYHSRMNRPLAKAVSVQEIQDFVIHLLTKRETAFYNNATIILSAPSCEKLRDFVANFV